MRRLKQAVSVAALGAVLVTSLTAIAFDSWPIGLSKTSLRGHQHFLQTKIEHPAMPLKGFAFEFQNGDHALREVGVFAAGDQMHVSFADRNADDPYKVTANWWPMPLTDTSPRRVAKKTDCAGSCRVPVAAPPSGGPWRLILSGFKLSRPGATDANISRIAVRPNTAGRYYDVTFKDSRGNSANQFAAEITYYYCAAKALSDYGSVDGHRRSGQADIALKVPGNRFGFLVGFDVRFSSGDHHVKTFAVEPSHQTGSNWNVRFNDNNLDDEVDAVIDYAVPDSAYVAAQKK